MSPDLLELQEHKSRTVRLRDDAVRAISRLSSRTLTIAPASDAGFWKVTAGSRVGTLSLPGTQILIRPKIALENLLALLDAGIPDRAWADSVFSYGVRPDLLRAFIGFFSRSLETLTIRGLHRAYQPRSERLVALRGRIDFPAQTRQAVLPSPVACIYDEHTLDTPENRYLLGVAERLVRTAGIDSAAKSLLRHTITRFEDVRPHLPSVDELDALTLTRLNEHYRPTLRLARLIIQNSTIADSIGSHGAGTFLLDMNTVFEDFVSRRLRTMLRGRLQVLDQTPRHLDRKGTVPIRPDLEFRRDDRTVLVGDIKYKLTGSGRARSSDYFQLLSYCTVLGLDRGVLIYAQSDEDPSGPHHLTVTGGGQRLSTHRIDLAGSPEDIESALAHLAEDLAETTRRTESVAATNAAGLSSERWDLRWWIP